VETKWREMSDELGPFQVVLIRTGELEAIVVVDNVAVGPGMGGVRMAPDVSIHEVARLARAMTLKNAAARLPFGGAKAGVVADPAMEATRKEQLMRAFARAIKDLKDYIPGPDMGTDERCMAWIKDENGRAVGLPQVLGGIPLDEIGATGYGLAACAEAVEELGYVSLRGMRVVVQGFGAVGRHAARFLVERGAILIGASDVRGAVVDERGLDVMALAEFKSAGRSVGDFPAGTRMARDELLYLDCDALIPAARPDVLTEANAERVRARVILEGANIPATPAAEIAFFNKGIVVVPDFIANAGGVICATVEYGGGTAPQAFALIEEKVRGNTHEVLARSKEEGIPPRRAAERMALERIREAQTYGR
jgi:glutamate dehydrogenase/leucine dehydrogenase